MTESKIQEFGTLKDPLDGDELLPLADPNGSGGYDNARTTTQAIADLIDGSSLDNAIDVEAPLQKSVSGGILTLSVDLVGAGMPLAYSTGTTTNPASGLLETSVAWGSITAGSIITVYISKTDRNGGNIGTALLRVKAEAEFRIQSEQDEGIYLAGRVTANATDSGTDVAISMEVEALLGTLTDTSEISLMISGSGGSSNSSGITIQQNGVTQGSPGAITTLNFQRSLITVAGPVSTIRSNTLAWAVITTSTTASAFSGYISDSASQLSLTLPSSPTIGDTIEVIGQGSGGWLIVAPSGSSLRSSTTSGTQAIGGQWTALRLIAISATQWFCYPIAGTVTISSPSTSAYRYYYIVATSAANGSTGDFELSEFQIYETIGGANAFSGGTPVNNTTLFTGNIANLFNNDPSGGIARWLSPPTFGYDLGAGNSRVLAQFGLAAATISRGLGTFQLFGSNTGVGTGGTILATISGFNSYVANQLIKWTI